MRPRQRRSRGCGRRYGGGFLPTRAGRLVTSGLHPIETKAQVRKLAGGVLIYCSEPGKRRGMGDLLLWVDCVGTDMARATPFLGAQRANAKILRVGHDGQADALTLPLKSPLYFTLVHLDRRGHVQRIERRDIIELGPSR